MKIYDNGIIREIADPTPSAEDIRYGIMSEIYTLKDALYASDYKITICTECSLMGAPLPYDIEALHAERQALRDRINELEAQLRITTNFD